MEPTETLTTLNSGRVGLLIGVAASTVVAASFCIFLYLVDDDSWRWRGMKRGGRFFGHFERWGFLGRLVPMTVALDF